MRVVNWMSISSSAASGFFARTGSKADLKDGNARARKRDRVVITRFTLLRSTVPCREQKKLAPSIPLPAKSLLNVCAMAVFPVPPMPLSQ